MTANSKNKISYGFQRFGHNFFTKYIGFYLLATAYLSSHVSTSAIQKQNGNIISNGRISNLIMTLPEHIITDCILVTSKIGHYYYKTSRGNYDREGETCGVYLMADADETIQVHFDYVNMPCDSEGIVSFVDGWELNGSYFPSEDDYPKDGTERFREFCGKRRIKRVLESSQNAALVRYRVAKPGQGFSFYFTTKKNTMPCNVLVESETFVYTLRNFGKPNNCSLMSMNPTKIKILSLTVGITDNVNKNLETGTYHNCDKEGMVDYVEIGGGVALGQISLPFDTVCGIDSKGGSTVDSVFCGVTTVRLVSSGNANNQVTVSTEKLHPNDSELPGFMCPQVGN